MAVGNDTQQEYTHLCKCGRRIFNFRIACITCSLAIVEPTEEATDDGTE